MDEDVQATAARLVRRIKEGNHTITVAESCTGGLLASAFTDIAGASQWFQQSWVTYSNEAKIKELGVKESSLEKRGAVSAEVAIQMAQGARINANASIAISITGIAGPNNDGSNKKIGTVYVGIASDGWANSDITEIGGNRAENKIAFVHFALLTAIKYWDKAMENAELARVEEESRATAEKDAKILFEEERSKREEDAREKGILKDDTWSGKGKSHGSKESISNEVHWENE
ncbi:MAG: nicotinamide-nucleotide amidohydrolase family protein [Euryarchaeota archaeon]|nr:nicotinamide-nucleotide amidohydrolase family protein [Euryarchaeota archaeon]